MAARIPLECEVVHAIPGRIRLRVPQLSRVNGYSQAFVRYFSAQPGIKSVRVNATASSAVIY
ncbi:MAG: HMA2 domain-containing protein, partial [Candidatus Xenobia bacterium]